MALRDDSAGQMISVWRAIDLYSSLGSVRTLFPVCECRAMSGHGGESVTEMRDVC